MVDFLETKKNVLLNPNKIKWVQPSSLILVSYFYFYLFIFLYFLLLTIAFYKLQVPFCAADYLKNVILPWKINEIQIKTRGRAKPMDVHWQHVLFFWTAFHAWSPKKDICWSSLVQNSKTTFIYSFIYFKPPHLFMYLAAQSKSIFELNQIIVVVVASTIAQQHQRELQQITTATWTKTWRH